MKRLETVPNVENIEDSIKNDRAKRNCEIIDFIKLLDKTEGPFCWMVDAAWGDGKTFFVRSVEHVLDALNPNIKTDFNKSHLGPVINELESTETLFLPFYFNAWENDFFDDPTIALFASMAADFDRMEVTRQNRIGESLATLIDIGLTTCQAGFKASDVLHNLKPEDLIAAYKKRLDMRERIVNLAEESLPEVADKLVIFIDELDRCRPDFAVKLLEQTKSLFQSENIIVVLSADSVQLACAVGGMYGTGFDSQHFLERFYDSRVFLAHPDPYAFYAGSPYPITSHAYDKLAKELLDRNTLTIRDYSRIKSKLEAGRAYCDTRTSTGPADFIAKCAVLPLLIFMSRSDTELFRNVTNGYDFDALYEYGSQYAGFLSIVDRCVKWESRTDDDVGVLDEELLKEKGRTLARNLCIVLYSSDTRSEQYLAAKSSLDSSFMNLYFDPRVYKMLEFPSECNIE